MNQILSVEMPGSKKQNKKANINSIIIFFCIILLIFGIALISIGIFSKSKSPDNKNEIVDQPIVVSEPEIEIIQDLSKLNVTVTSENMIARVIYKWNNEEETQINGNNENVMKLPAINIPTGSNIFTITAIDEKGETKTFKEEFIGKEIFNPSISLVGQKDNEITMQYESDIIVKQISYYFDNEEIKTEEVNNLSGEISIKVLEGQHVLTVEVINEKGESYKEEKEINIPKAKVTTDGENFIVEAEDTSAEGFVKIKTNMNGVEEEKDISGTTYEETIKLIDGENRLIVILTNSDGLSITKRVRWEKK